MDLFGHAQKQMKCSNKYLLKGIVVFLVASCNWFACDRGPAKDNFDEREKQNMAYAVNLVRHLFIEADPSAKRLPFLNDQVWARPSGEVVGMRAAPEASGSSPKKPYFLDRWGKFFCWGFRSNFPSSIKVTVWSTGPNGIDEGGRGDDILHTDTIDLK
jgi:hypothetical protein